MGELMPYYAAEVACPQCVQYEPCHDPDFWPRKLEEAVREGYFEEREKED